MKPKNNGMAFLGGRQDDVLAIFTWLSAGVQEDLRTRVNSGMEVDEYEKLVRHRLAIYKASLTHGIYK